MSPPLVAPRAHGRAQVELAYDANHQFHFNDLPEVVRNTGSVDEKANLVALLLVCIRRMFGPAGRWNADDFVYGRLPYLEVGHSFAPLHAHADAPPHRSWATRPTTTSTSSSGQTSSTTCWASSSAGAAARRSSARRSGGR